MRLSKQAIQLTIDETYNKIEQQGIAIQKYKDEIERLQTERLDLKELILNIKAGTEAKYDIESLEKNITRVEDNIVIFEQAISDMETQTADYHRMIATLEVKKDTEGF